MASNSLDLFAILPHSYRLVSRGYRKGSSIEMRIQAQENTYFFSLRISGPTCTCDDYFMLQFEDTPDGLRMALEGVNTLPVSPNLRGPKRYSRA